MSMRDHHLQAIYDQHERLTPELVVEAARPKAHPLHAAIFDRTPKEAADSWWRHRASELIRTARITYRTDSGKSVDVRAFHCIRQPDGNSYEPVEKVVADPFTRELLLRDMEREWNALFDRYKEFTEFVDLVQGVERAVERWTRIDP